jgi:hypothetical protein
MNFSKVDLNFCFTCPRTNSFIFNNLTCGLVLGSNQYLLPPKLPGNDFGFKSAQKRRVINHLASLI